MPVSGRPRTLRPPNLRIADVSGWPPTCAYADMNRLKSNEVIPRREPFAIRP
jgi:hypothetical protein